MQILFIQGGGEGSYAWDMPLVTAIQTTLNNGSILQYPKMPQEEKPDYQLWKGAILKEIGQMDEPIVLIGHSLGGSVLLKLLSENNIRKGCKALFLVSTPFWGEPNWHAESFMLAENFADKLPVIAEKFIYHAEDDDIVEFSHHRQYADHLKNARVRTFKQGGHQMLVAVDTLVNDINNLALI